MEIGVLAFPSDLTFPPHEVARAAEERGFESVFFPEHSHLPLDSGPWPGGPVVPEHYAHTLDLFSALGAAAAATDRILLGSGICIVPQHDAIWLAKQVATIDHVSQGRFVFGIGFGWNRPELADHGATFAERRESTREHVATMKALWSDEVASFEGRWTSFGPSRAWPKPTQRPHPPILVAGGAGPRLRAAVVDYADGWAPIEGRNEVLAELPALREAWKAAGRAPDELQVTVFGAQPDHLAALAEAGVKRAVLALPVAPAEMLLQSLDHLAGHLEKSQLR
ncbi:MAG: TIGR03619 family F420-dependent LLM class oxidoreductase [Acidimicrobiia bacterium]|nr:TIGR03619 family F420-dependent LLM class oxidoreductase [Acidimicrobiia bacterium]